MKSFWSAESLHLYVNLSVLTLWQMFKFRTCFRCCTTLSIYFPICGFLLCHYFSHQPLINTVHFLFTWENTTTLGQLHLRGEICILLKKKKSSSRSWWQASGNPLPRSVPFTSDSGRHTHTHKQADRMVLHMQSVEPKTLLQIKSDGQLLQMMKVRAVAFYTICPLVNWIYFLLGAKWGWR